MATNSSRDLSREPSEFDPAPGEPQNDDDRRLKELRDEARRTGEAVPPSAGEYAGWDRESG